MHHSTGGFELVVSLVLMAGLGLLVDRALGTLPWFTLGMALLGFAGATINMWYRYQASMATAAAERAAGANGVAS